MNNYLGLNESVLSFELPTLALGLPRLLVPLYYSDDILALFKETKLCFPPRLRLLCSPARNTLSQRQRCSSTEIDNSPCFSGLCQPPPSFGPQLGPVLGPLEVRDRAEALGAPGSPGMGQAQKGACGWLRDPHRARTWETPGPPSLSLLLFVQGTCRSRGFGSGSARQPGGGAAAPRLFLFP